MKNFFDYVRDEFHVSIPKGDIPGEWFYENKIPMVVRCCCCDMTMASPSAWVDDEGYTYCASCADVVEG